MAKENTVRLFGVVDAVKIVIRPSKEDGEPEFVSGRVFMTVVSRARMTSKYIKEGPKRTDGLIVFSRDPVVIKYIANARKGDAVEVKGTAVSQDIERVYRCTECGEETVFDKSTTEYIDPIYFGIRARAKSEEFPSGTDKQSIKDFVLQVQSEGNNLTYLTTDALAKLIERFLRDRFEESKGIPILDEKQMREFMGKQGEIGNELCCFGTLTRDPSPDDYYPGDDRHIQSFKFQMALNRIRRIMADSSDKKADYFYFVSYGKFAPFYYEHLKKGSTVYVTGPIMTRPFKRIIHCENCGCEYERPGTATEIKVQNLVFVRNCGMEAADVGEDDYDDIMEAEEEKAREMEKSLLDGLVNSKTAQLPNEENEDVEEEDEYADDDYTDDDEYEDYEYDEECDEEDSGEDGEDWEEGE